MLVNGVNLLMIASDRQLTNDAQCQVNLPWLLGWLWSLGLFLEPLGLPLGLFATRVASAWVCDDNSPLVSSWCMLGITTWSSW